MKSWWAYRPKRNVYVASILTGCCAGLFFGRQVTLTSSFILFSAITCVIAFKKRGWYLVFASLLVGLSLGLWRSSSFVEDVGRYGAYFGKTVVLEGRVSDDPGYNDLKLIEFHVSDVRLESEELPGRVRVRSQNAYSVKRGDNVKVSGTLRQTLGTSRQGSISYGQVIVTQENKSFVEKTRRKFFASVFSSLPEPQASLGLGYLAGVRAALPLKFADALSVVGLTHIVAVSGYNLTILVQFVKRLFEKRSAFQTVFFSSLLLAGFILVTGWSPSITRAALIAGFSLAAWYYGRRFQPLVLILLGAAVTAFINPLYIWGDVGWYLSFLAFTGVLVVAPMFLYFIGGIGKNFFVKILAETLSAQLMTAPYILAIFGNVSVISPLANILVVPFIPFAMLAVFAAGLAGLISASLGLWVAIPARAIMTVTVWIVEKLAKIPWAKTQAELSMETAILIYCALLIAVVGVWLIYLKRSKVTKTEIDWNLL